MNSFSQKRILSGIQPSHLLTLGNYLGALKNWVNLQKEAECFFMVPDLHAITVRQDPIQLKNQTYQAVATYLAAGIDSSSSTLFIQSHVSEHSELSWILNCFTYMGELSRMTQFKDKSAKQGQNIGAGLFNYPVLMAADILLYQTHLVPVGEDQKQHIELTRDIAQRMNQVFGEPVFQIPEVFTPPLGARIMSLQNPLAKMSKSDSNPQGAIYLSDTSDQILKKLKRAVTDSGSEITYDESKPGIRNLIQIQASLKNQDPAQIVESYVGKQYGHLKIDTAEIIIQALEPIRKKTVELMTDLSYIDSILEKGRDQARSVAFKTLSEVRERIGCLKGRY